MRKTIIAASILLALALPLSANDSPTATKFLFDYVGALRLINAGDALMAKGDCSSAREQFAQARNLIEPYELRHDLHQSWNMVESARTVMKTLETRATCNAAIETPGQPGPLADSAVDAAWALVSSDEGIWIGARDRRHAIRDLEQEFGRVTAGPNVRQNDVQIAASTIAYFLANPPIPHVDPWGRYVPPPWQSSRY
ncbi:MAG TPA: hypothetical protein VEZ11_10665 [Thermoanaerobaculia bacterium]|nr:hypothetical protein [Thermoanaerobaculia bacterium]